MLRSFFWGTKFDHLAMKRIPVTLMYQGFLCTKMHRKTSDCKNIARFLNFSTFPRCTQNLSNSSCGWLPVWIHHRIGGKNPGCAASFFYHGNWSLRELPLENLEFCCREKFPLVLLSPIVTPTLCFSREKYTSWMGLGFRVSDMLSWMLRQLTMYNFFLFDFLFWFSLQKYIYQMTAQQFFKQVLV